MEPGGDRDDWSVEALLPERVHSDERAWGGYGIVPNPANPCSVPREAANPRIARIHGREFITQPGEASIRAENANLACHVVGDIEMQVRMDELRAHAGLTQPEAQVALMMAEQFSHRGIAMELDIKPNTARRHCEKVLLKLGISRRQDVAEALGKVPGPVLIRHGADLNGVPPPLAG